MIKQRIHEYLMHSAHKKVYQVDIAKDLNCTEMHVSKTIKELRKKGIIVKQGKNAVAVINPYLLCAGLAYETMPESPLYFQAPEFKDVLAVLRKAKYYCITSESAKLIKEGKVPKIITARILVKDIPLLREYFNEVIHPSKANLTIYPSNIMKFMINHEQDEVEVANDWLLLYDLASRLILKLSAILKS